MPMPASVSASEPKRCAAMIAAGRWLVGDNELGVRLVAVLSGVVLSGLLYRLGALVANELAGWRQRA